MPLTTSTYVIGGPDLLTALCDTVGVHRGRYSGFVLVLIPEGDPGPQNPVNIKTDAPDQATLTDALRTVLEVLEGKR